MSNPSAYGTTTVSKAKHEFRKISPTLDTAEQKEAWQIAPKADILFLTGPPRTGKTFVAAALAIDQLSNPNYERICILRPAVTATGEDLGALPGDIKEKISPFLSPVYKELDKVCEIAGIHRSLVTKETLTLAYLRGCNLDNCIVIVDEAQNMTRQQFRLLFSRMCRDCRVIVTGDPDQVDIRPQHSYLAEAVYRMKPLTGVESVEFKHISLQGHRLVPEIMDVI